MIQIGKIKKPAELLSPGFGSDLQLIGWLI